MIAAAALLAFAVFAVAGASALAGAAWPARSPAVAIWAWQSLSGAAAVAIVLAGLAIALPETPLSGAMADTVRANSTALARHYSTPGGLPVAVVALTCSAVVVARFIYFLSRDRRSTWRSRREQISTLDLVASKDPRGYRLLPHDVEMVYCVPGRRPAIVVTRGAAESLTPRQLDLVLAHERQHLRSRHDLALAISRALARTFGDTGLFLRAHEQIGVLAEMQADDSARHGTDRRELAAALLRLSPHGHHLNAGVSGTGGTGRVVRLVRPTVPLVAGERYAAAVLGLALLGAPFGLALSPAVEAAVHGCCSVVRSAPPHPVRGLDAHTPHRGGSTTSPVASSRTSPTVS